MKAVAIAFLLLAPLGLIGGCSFEVSVNEKTETEMGSHSVVVKPGSSFTSSSSISIGDTETLKFSCGDTSITIRNGELTVNDVSYGAINPDDSILIDDGKVFVESQEREAIADSNTP